MYDKLTFLGLPVWCWCGMVLSLYRSVRRCSSLTSFRKPSNACTCMLNEERTITWHNCVILDLCLYNYNECLCMVYSGRVSVARESDLTYVNIKFTFTRRGVDVFQYIKVYKSIYTPSPTYRKCSRYGNNTKRNNHFLSKSVIFLVCCSRPCRWWLKTALHAFISSAVLYIISIK